jgi:alkylhydroperoxidase/carboxymuconolactone decarboxylase family protein YurZ
MSNSDRLKHYEDSMGSVPAAIGAMFAMDEKFANAYTDIRELIYTDRPDGMPLAQKELLLVMFDLAVSNKDGAINHLSAARRAGLTETALYEALMIAFLVVGVSGWGKVGYHLWETWQQWNTEEGTAGESSATDEGAQR